MDIWKKLSIIFNRQQKIRLGLLFAAIFIGAGLELLGVGLIYPLITIITTPDMVQENALLRWAYEMFSIGSLEQFVLFFIWVLVAVYILKNIFLTAMYYGQYTFIYNNQLRLASQLIDCYLKKPYTYHLDKNSAEMVRNVMLDTERMFQLLLTVLNVASEILISLMLGLFLLVTEPGMTIAVAITLLVTSVLYTMAVKGRVRDYGRQNQQYDGKMHQAVNQALGAVKDIKILHREKYFVNAFAGFGRKKMNAVKNSNFLGQVPKYLVETVCIITVLISIAYKVQTGTPLGALVPTLSAFAAAALKLLPSVSKVSNYMNLIIFLKPSVDLIYRDLKETEDMAGFEHRDREQGMLSEKADRISVRHVSFAYPGTETDVIKDVSFDIPLGASVGLVGPSGAGKSTMADIILGILHPGSGEVLYGSMNVHENPLKWSKKLAYIPQAIFLSDESIRNNVAFGIETEDIEEEKVWRALEEAQLKGFVESLERGLDTLVGERGVRLSGGQRQRIGIARALYDDPEVLVLDEATSALDNETETAVMEAIDRLQGRKTLIIIAHRLTTIKNCDMVFKVENGKVMEETQ